MNKIILPIIILPLIFTATVFAQETELPDPGLTPDSPFYFLETIAEGIGTFFSFGDLKKAERYTNLAAERLAEAKVMAEQGKPKLLEKTLERYEDQLVKALLRTEKAKTKGKNTEEVIKTITEATHKHFTVLEEVLEKVPEEAKPAIRHAMMVSTKEGLEIAVKAASERGFESLRAECIERGQKGQGPQEICEKIPLQGFESFESLRAFCVEAEGSPEVCASMEATCLKLGVTTPDECLRVISTVKIETIPVSEKALEEGKTQIEIGQNYEVIKTKCLESGAPPEVCASIEKALQSSKPVRGISS
jgi:hypothetical protein